MVRNGEFQNSLVETTIGCMEPLSEESITMLGRIDFRSDRRIFGIKQADRRAHTYIIGKTGTGKSTLLENLARQDIECGRGLGLLDSHGDLVERLLAAVPETRKEDLIYFNVPDTSRPLGFNPVEPVA